MNRGILVLIALLWVAPISACEEQVDLKSESDAVVHVNIEFGPDILNSGVIDTIWRDGLLLTTELSREVGQPTLTYVDFGPATLHFWRFQFSDSCQKADDFIQELLVRLYSKTSVKLSAPDISIECSSGPVVHDDEPIFLDNEANE